MPLGIRFRNLRRLRQILSVLVFEYGFGALFDQVGISRLLPLGRRWRTRPPEGALSPKRLRLALAHLGPSFIKLGQILSARPDLLPQEMIIELRHLQDEGPTVPFDLIRGVIESELGQPLTQLFSYFNEEPSSSASLAQVHTALLHDGRSVNVKVLRPGVEAVVQADLQVFTDVAHVLDRNVPALHLYDLPGFVRQFADQVHAELSYTVEAYNTQRAREQAEAHPTHLVIPEVIWSHTSRRVFTMEHIAGHRVDRLAEPREPVDRAARARQFGEFMLRQIFIEGFFHGDPHQGNVLLMEDGRLALLDWGIVGFLDPKLRRLLAEVLRAIYQHDVDEATSIVTELGSPRLESDVVSLRQYLARIISRAEIFPPKEFSLGDMLSQTIRAMSLHQIRVPLELSLAAKALVVSEGVCRDLDPSFDFREVVQPVVEEEQTRAAEFTTMLERTRQSLHTFTRQLTRLPGRIDTILSLLERGSLRIRMEDKEADRRVLELSRSLNRLALSVLASAIFLTGALIFILARGPSRFTLGSILLIIAAILSSFVALSVLRWRRL